MEIADGVRAGKRTATAAIEDALARIARGNARLNAFIRTDAEMALRQAREIDRKVARGEDPGPLAGVPLGVKDIENCIGFPITQGSWFLRNEAPCTSDSHHVARLRAAGAIPIGITAMSEFGMDSATFTKAYGATRNPWNPQMTPGGSSGGSAAAVAAGLVPLATGTDAGGSIREPAAFTNLIGLKPAHGRIAKMNGFANWAVHGALTRSVRETARYLDVAAGPDDRDRQSLPAVPFSYEDIIETLDVGGLRAVFSADHGYAVVEPEVVALARDAASRLIRAANLTELHRAFAPVNVYRHWGAIMLYNLEEDFVRQGILPNGYDMLSDQTKRSLTRIRERRAEIDLKQSWNKIYQLEQEMAAFFLDADLLMSPATACAPYPADSTIPETIDGRDASESGVEPFGVVANVCWNPSISVPAGFTAAGLPVGLQITARRHRDDILLRLARIHEQTFPWSFPWD
ncbi:MAG: amidase [Alphaproteobacteria bacterium]|nr:amidase [Alphaproteobacteria bacterium]